MATIPLLLTASTWTTPLLAPAAGDYFAPDAQRHPLFWVGMGSYGAYLWHQPLSAFARTIADIPPFLLTLGVGGGALILGAASARWVETPIRRWAHTWNPLHAVPAAAGLAAMGCAVAAFVEDALAQP